MLKNVDANLMSVQEHFFQALFWHSSNLMKLQNKLANYTHFSSCFLVLSQLYILAKSNLQMITGKTISSFKHGSLFFCLSSSLTFVKVAVAVISFPLSLYVLQQICSFLLSSFYLEKVRRVGLF